MLIPLGRQKSQLILRLEGQLTSFAKQIHKKVSLFSVLIPLGRPVLIPLGRQKSQLILRLEGQLTRFAKQIYKKVSLFSVLIPLGLPVLIPLGRPVLIPLGQPVLIPLGHRCCGLLNGLRTPPCLIYCRFVFSLDFSYPEVHK